MKRMLISIIILMIITLIRSYSWTKGGGLDYSLFLDPHDEKNILITGTHRSDRFDYDSIATYVIDLTTHKIVNSFPIAYTTNSIAACNSDYHLMAYNAADYPSFVQRLLVYDYSSGINLLNIIVPSSDFRENCFSISKDGKRVLGIYNGSTKIQSWDIKSGTKLADYDLKLDINIYKNIKISNDGEKITYYGNDSMFIIRTSDGSLINALKLESPIYSMGRYSFCHFGPDNNTIYFSDSNQYNRIYDINLKKYIYENIDSNHLIGFSGNCITNNSKYLYWHDLMDSNAVIIDLLTGNKQSVKIDSGLGLLYVSNDLTTYFQMATDYGDCWSNNHYLYRYYNFKEFNKDSILLNVPEGLISANASTLIPSFNSKFFVAFNFTTKYYDYQYNIIRVKDSSVINSYHVLYEPIAFLSDSEFLLKKDTWLYKYDFVKHQLKDSIKANIKFIKNLTIDRTHNKILTNDYSSITVVNIDDFSIEKNIYIPITEATVQFTKIDEEGKLNVLTGERQLIIFDLENDTKETISMTNLTASSLSVADISSYSEYALVTGMIEDSLYVGLWDIKNDYLQFANKITRKRKISSVSFLRDPFLILINYEPEIADTVPYREVRNIKSNKYENIPYTWFKINIMPNSDNYLISGCPGIYTMKQIQENLISEVGKHKLNSKNELVLFPNPARDRIFIKPGNNIVNPVVVVYNLQGERVEAPIMANLNNLEISTIGLPSGMYFVRIANGGEVLTKSFVVER